MTTHLAASDLPRNARRSEAGSAYLAVLLVLVVLTILGLSLAVVTQTEVLIGGSEKQATRQLFAADTGVDLATAFQLVTHASARHELTLRERTQNLFGGDTVIGDTICTTPYVQIHTATCDLCEIGKYESQQFGVTINALRHGDAVLGARKTVGAVMSIEPMPVSDPSSALQFGSDDAVKTPDDPTIDIDPTTETDPCEGLYLKI